MQPPEAKTVEIERADFFEPVVFGSASGTKRAFVNGGAVRSEIASMSADMRNNVLLIVVKRHAHEEKHYVPFANIKSMLTLDLTRRKAVVEPPPAEKPKPRPVVDDTIKL